MKIRLWYFFGCLCCTFLALVGYADPTSEIIEQFPSGTINWTRGVVTATGNSSIRDVDRQAEQGGKYDRAYQQAIQNLRQTLTRLRLNNQNCILDLLSTQTQTLKQLKAEEMTASAKVVDKTQNPAGDIAVTLEMNLYGGFAQLMLPSDVRQVESIKPLNGSGGDSYNPNQVQSTQNQSSRTEPDAFSGLIVDARGIGVSPSMVPVLVDENGQEVYGPAYVSREFAVQNGMCRYIRGVDNSYALPRVAPNPMLVKGLRAVSKGDCDIVISNADASRLRGVSSHLEFLKQCRVVIIID
jgi:hypothetical protein